MGQRRYEYIRLREKNEIAFMSRINDYGSKGYRICKWYEKPEDNIYMAVMERIRF